MLNNQYILMDTKPEIDVVLFCGGGYVYSAFCPTRKCQHHQMEYIKNGNEDAARQKIIEKWNKEQENHE